MHDRERVVNSSYRSNRSESIIGSTSSIGSIGIVAIAMAVAVARSRSSRSCGPSSGIRRRASERKRSSSPR